MRWQAWHAKDYRQDYIDKCIHASYLAMMDEKNNYIDKPTFVQQNLFCRVIKLKVRLQVNKMINLMLGDCLDRMKILT